jgi:hypothetical protein
LLPRLLEHLQTDGAAFLNPSLKVRDQPRGSFDISRPCAGCFHRDARSRPATTGRVRRTQVVAAR